MPIAFFMEPGSKTILTPVKNVPFANLVALRAATAALVAAATAVNTRTQATTPALTVQQQEAIADSIAVATYQIDLARKALGI